MGKLHIDSVDLPGTRGRIGICACPGGRTLYSGASLSEDLDSIRAWGASGIVTLIEDEEIHFLGITSIGDECSRRDMWWLHMPIRDMCAPDARFDARWRQEGSQLRGRLAAGENFVVHCWAGLGRAGTIAARLLTEFGVPAEHAIARVRAARPGAIQSLQQEIYLRRQND